MPNPSIASLILAHRTAVLAGEAMFADDCRCLSGAGAKATEEVERQAFIALVGAPCLSVENVAAKIDYFVNGTVADRSSLIDYLTEYSDGDFDLTRRLLQSMIGQGSHKPLPLDQRRDRDHKGQRVSMEPS